MKRMITKLAIVTIVVLFGNSLKTKAQVTPSTADVQFVCSGSTLPLGTPPTGTKWIVKYGKDNPNDNPTSITVPTDNIIPANDVKTGYYIITSENIAGGCESDVLIIPVYVFEPITASITADDYCINDAANTTITGSVTSTAPAGTTFAYQWYASIDGDAEAPLSGKTSATLTPTTITNATNDAIPVVFRLRVGYMINGTTDKYCGTDATKSINVLPKPGKPSITVGASPEGW